MHESLIRLFRAFCQPSALYADTRELRARARLRLMLQMVPALLAANVLIGGSVSMVAQAINLPAGWLPSGLAISAIGLGIGVFLGTVWSVVAGITWAATWGPTYWIFTHALSSFVHLLWPLEENSIQIWWPLGLAAGVAAGATMRRPRYALPGLGLAVLITGLQCCALPAGVGFLLLFLLCYFGLEWYVVDVGVTLVQFLVARSNRAQAQALLHKSPIYWREPIWLPLVGLVPFLRLIGDQDFGQGVSECFFVIAERPTQAKAARAALLEIVARHMAELTTLEQIASGARELEHAQIEEVPLPAPLAEALHSLQQLARHAEQHLTTLLPHNQRRALERLRDGSEDLARKLTLAQGSLALTLIQVARHWRAVAEAALTRMGEAEAAAGYIHNPFVFGQPIEETETNLFVGRRDTVKEIEISLLGGEQKPALVLYGPRRMGKTSVLLQLPRLLGQEFVPAFVDMQSMQVRESVVSFFTSITGAAAQAMRRRGLQAEGLQSEHIQASPFSAFSDWCETVEARLVGAQHLLLCLDEFERLETSITEGRLPGELMDEIRHIIQHHPRVVLLFAGSHRPDELALNWPDVLISTKLIRVSYLAENDARQLITQPVPEFALDYRPGSVDRILEITRCQPYLVQAVCYELVNHLNVEGRQEATAQDVDLAKDRALESAHLYFAEMWRQLSARQRALLLGVCRGSEVTGSGELAERAGAAPEQAEQDLRTLESRGTLERAGEAWRFQVPLVQTWVSRQSE